jgi:hypothetical protein
LQHRELKCGRLNLQRLSRFTERFLAARSAAEAAPSSRGPFSDSPAVYHLGLELAEELLLLAYALPRRVTDVHAIRATVAPLWETESKVVGLSPLRKRMIDDARWRLERLGLNVTRNGPSYQAFPARNRMLNLRSTLMNVAQKSGKRDGPTAATFNDLVLMWRRFDSQAAMAPCRIALAGVQTRAEGAAALWHESLDIARGGKRYFAWLRDRYYLEDGFGPMLLRANFALTVGFYRAHEDLLNAV